MTNKIQVFFKNYVSVLCSGGPKETTVKRPSSVLITIADLYTSLPCVQYLVTCKVPLLLVN